MRPGRSPRRTRRSKLWTSTAVEAGFRRLARLRGAPALHPRGLTCTAVVEVAGDGAWGVGWLDTSGRYDATVRLSRAAGLPPGLPDGLGLAVRVEQADGPDRPLDLLLTSSGPGTLSRHLPLSRADALGGPYSSLLPYHVGGRHHVLAAFPRRSRPAAVHGDPTSLRAALAAGPLVFELCAKGARRSWLPFALLTIGTPLPMRREETPDFDIYAHSVRGLAPSGALATTRRAAYRGSRAARRGTTATRRRD